MIITVGKKKDYSKNQIILSSFFLAMVILSQNVMQIGSMLFNYSNLFEVLLIIACVYSIYMFGIELSNRNIVLLLFVFVSFGITFIFLNNEYVYIYFRYFLLYGLGGYVISQNKINEKYLYTITTVIGLVWLLIYVINYGFIVYDNFSFGYLLFPFVTSSYLLFFNTKDNKFIRFISLIICIILITILFFSGARGSLLSFFIFILMFFIGKDRFGLKKSIVFIVLIVLLLNIQFIIEYLHELFPGKISFIEKSLFLEQSGVGITNGRDRIFQSILNKFSFFDFIFGAGIGKYAAINGGRYTHNIFTSISLDFGIIPVMYLLYRCIYVIKRNIDKRDNISLFLFSISIIPLCFSGLFWMSFPFWLFIFFDTNNNMIEVNDD